jgi:transcriptional regulator with XRE-family HTH domain/predicted Fe-Mo cluster-binding NifX family protein
MKKTAIEPVWTPAEVRVAHKLRELRMRSGLSLRALADRSGLNINTLSLIENGKTSPSVSTQQQLALALNISIAVFFESDPVEKSVVYTPVDKRPQTSIGTTQMQNLGKDFSGNAVQPFLVTLQPGVNSGDRVIVHTGYEYVFCLSGIVEYHINDDVYLLEQGDSLLFEANLPHCWKNSSTESSQFLIILYPTDVNDEPSGHHFSKEHLIQEVSMKIAVITDDGKTISQHFGRAAYYLVLTIEEGKVVQREMRPKMGHSQFSGENHAEVVTPAGHGMDSASHTKHTSMAGTISDCKVLLCGGMGMGAYDSMRQLNIQPVVTDLSDIDAAVEAFISGKLIDHTELLH